MIPLWRGSTGGRIGGDGGAEGFGVKAPKGRGDNRGYDASGAEAEDGPQTPPTGRVIGSCCDGEELSPKTSIGPGAAVITVCSGTREVGANRCCRPEPEPNPGVVLLPTPLPPPIEGAVTADRDLEIFLPSSSLSPISDPATVRGDPPTIVHDGAVDNAPWDTDVAGRGTSGGGRRMSKACLAAST